MSGLNLSGFDLSWIGLAWIGLAFPFGAAIGVAFFQALRLNVRLYLGTGPWWQPVVLLVVRIALAVAGLGSLVLAGFLPALAGLAGFTLARLVMVRRAKREEEA